MRAHALVVLVALGLAGCHFGSRMENLEPARSARGAKVRLLIGRNEQLRGELLIIADTAAVIQKGDGVLVLVLYRSLTIMEVEHLGSNYVYYDRYARSPGAELRERWRLVARYPQGLSDGQVAELLAVKQQPALDVR